MIVYSKKINRGLVLGGICLICLVVYLIAEQLTFSKEKAKIEFIAEAYIETLEQVNQSVTSVSEAIPLLESYWTTNATTLSCNWTNMVINLHSFFSSPRCDVEHIESTLGQYRITQTGTNSAILECTYSFTVDLENLGNYLLICQQISLQDMPVTNPASLYRWSGTVQLKADMVYEKHNWMLAGIQTSILEQDIQSILE